jgi:hypothetical protein
MVNGTTTRLWHRLVSGEVEYSSALLAEAEAVLAEMRRELDRERELMVGGIVPRAERGEVFRPTIEA